MPRDAEYYCALLTSNTWFCALWTASMHVHLGNCESRNAERGTERGTEVKCGPRAIITCTVRAGRLYSLDWTGLTQKSVCQCRTEAKHTYLSLKLLA